MTTPTAKQILWTAAAGAAVCVLLLLANRAILTVADATAPPPTDPPAFPPAATEQEPAAGETATPTSNAEQGKVSKTDAEWKAMLTPEQYYVTRRAGTERAFTGKYWNTKEDGVYLCVCCGQPLFDSTTKYDSGTGWPSYFQPLSDEAIELREDRKLFFTRTEVVCSRCDAHLGHVFNDGPRPTGMRYCMNSAALNFQSRGDSPSANRE